MKTKFRKVKAVGFAIYNPLTVVVFNAHSADCVHDEVVAFPPKKEGTTFTVGPLKDGSRIYALVTAPERLTELRKWSPYLYRLLIFGKPEDLQKLGVPIIDAVLENGKVAKILSLTIEETRAKIENDAVFLGLKTNVLKHVVVKKKKKAPKEPMQPSEQLQDPDPVLIAKFRELQGKFKGSKIEFENLIMIPALLRLAREIKKDEFRKACRAVLAKGVGAATVKRYRLFIEKKGAPGYVLGQVVRAYYSAPITDRPKLAKLAREHKQSVLDLKLVLLGLKKFHAQA